MGSVIANALKMTPPDIDSPSRTDLWGMLQTGRALRKLGKKDLYRLLRWGPMAVADLVAEYFETDLTARHDRRAWHFRNLPRPVVSRQRARAADSRRGRLASGRLSQLCRRWNRSHHAGHDIRRESRRRRNPHQRRSRRDPRERRRSDLSRSEVRRRNSPRTPSSPTPTRSAPCCTWSTRRI